LAGRGGVTQPDISFFTTIFFTTTFSVTDWLEEEGLLNQIFRFHRDSEEGLFNFLFSLFVFTEREKFVFLGTCILKGDILKGDILKFDFCEI